MRLKGWVKSILICILVLLIVIACNDIANEKIEECMNEGYSYAVCEGRLK